ncbi:MAG: hypothetical protein M3O02_11140 [Acidobacteriota bacterium]|nr:hypothetical protein [Acidobacteriota bacterium]
MVRVLARQRADQIFSAKLEHLRAWKAEALAAAAEEKDWRQKWNEKAVSLGYLGQHYLKAACAIADRCVAAERMVQRLRSELESDSLLEHEGKYYVLLHHTQANPALVGPFETKEEAVAKWREEQDNS